MKLIYFSTVDIFELVTFFYNSYYLDEIKAKFGYISYHMI